MLLRSIPLLSIILLSACSTNTVKHTEAKQNFSSKIKYAQNNSQIVPVDTISSSNDKCIDHFNFLHQAKDDKYKNYSREYIQISDGYRFLKTNKNIMSGDAKRVYTNTLDMKLKTLCSEVNYAGFQAIQQRINVLNNI